MAVKCIDDRFQVCVAEGGVGIEAYNQLVAVVVVGNGFEQDFASPTDTMLFALPSFLGTAAVDDGERQSGVGALQVLQSLLIVVVHGAVLFVAVVGPAFAVVHADIDVEVLETLAAKGFYKMWNVFVLSQYWYGNRDVAVSHFFTTLAVLLPQRRM